MKFFLAKARSPGMAGAARTAAAIHPLAWIGPSAESCLTAPGSRNAHAVYRIASETFGRRFDDRDSAENDAAT